MIKTIEERLRDYRLRDLPLQLPEAAVLMPVTTSISSAPSICVRKLCTIEYPCE